MKGMHESTFAWWLGCSLLLACGDAGRREGLTPLQPDGTGGSNAATAGKAGKGGASAGAAGAAGFGGDAGTGNVFGPGGNAGTDAGSGGGGSAGASGTGTGGGGVGKACASNADCAASELCDFTDGYCGNIGKGKCLARPTSCSPGGQATCGCDKKTYDNACLALKNGVDLSNLGGCPPPMPYDFGCGSIFCDTIEQFCEEVPPPVMGESSTFTCNLWPKSCGGGGGCVCLATADTCKVFDCAGSFDVGYTTYCAK